MKHAKQNMRAPQTHPSVLAVPSYHRILVKHGLIEKTLSIPDAYEVYLKVGADPAVEKLRRKVARGTKMKHVPALYLATAMALQGMTKQELEALKLRIEERRVMSAPGIITQGCLPPFQELVAENLRGLIARACSPVPTRSTSHL